MMTVSYTIREYENTDKAEVIDVVGKTLAGEHVVSCGELPLDDADLSDIPHYYSGKGKFWVAQQDGQIVGTVAISDKGNGTAKLRRMFVLHTLHGTGIGQKLLDTAIAYAKNLGFSHIVLNTHPLMKRAHRFYEKNGFVQKKELNRPDRYRYEKTLTSS